MSTPMSTDEDTGGSRTSTVVRPFGRHFYRLRHRCDVCQDRRCAVIHAPCCCHASSIHLQEYLAGTLCVITAGLVHAERPPGVSVGLHPMAIALWCVLVYAVRRQYASFTTVLSPTSVQMPAGVVAPVSSGGSRTTSPGASPISDTRSARAPGIADMQAAVTAERQLLLAHGLAMAQLQARLGSRVCPPGGIQKSTRLAPLSQRGGWYLCAHPPHSRRPLR
jgi:hypothetical protein